MSSSSNSRALIKRTSDTALMPPPTGSAPKRIKRPTTVLSEEDYTSRLSTIIKHRFFPGLVQSEAQIEYLDAMESGDAAWIADAGKRFEEAMRGVEPGMSLGEFYRRFTSEDNESVWRLIDRGNEERWHRLGWVRSGNMYASKQKLAQEKVHEARAIKEREESRGVIGAGARDLDADIGTSTATTNAVALRPSQDLDLRPAAPNSAPYTAYNALMFNPEGIEDHAKSRFQISESASLAPPKEILYHNTRLPPPVTAPTSTDPPSPTLTAVRDAISGRPRPTESESGFAGAETPRVNGYAFVDAEVPKPPPPEPEPEPKKEDRDLLDKYGIRADVGTRFRIQEEGRREKLHAKMVEKIAAEKTAKRGGAESGSGSGKGLGILSGQTPRFSYTPAVGGRGTTGGRKEVGGLTPAGRRLFERVGMTPGRQGAAGGGGGHGSGFGGKGGSGLGSEWTPTPRKRK